MKNTFKQVLQVILRVYVVKLTALYQQEDELMVTLHCCNLLFYLHTTPEDPWYRYITGRGHIPPDSLLFLSP